MSHQPASNIPVTRRYARLNQASTGGVGAGSRPTNDRNIMEPQQQGGDAYNTADGTASVQQMERDLAGLHDIITAQQQQIQTLLQTVNTAMNNSSAPSGSGGGALSTAKAPEIPAFSGKKDDQTSTRVKSFIYNVRKVGTLGGMTEPCMLELADCYLTDRAAMWMMNLEQLDTKPASMENLQTAMIAEFVPPDEYARAKAKLMKLKLTGSVDSFNSLFRELIEICGTPLEEGYMLYFTGLSDVFKGEFTKLFPTGRPASYQEMYQKARNFEVSRQWAAPTRSETKKPNVEKSRAGNKSARGNGSSSSRQKDTVRKDPLVASWGPAQANERNYYRKHVRCFMCGTKWEAGHSCAPGNEVPSGSASLHPKA